MRINKKGLTNRGVTRREVLRTAGRTVAAAAGAVMLRPFAGYCATAQQRTDIFAQVYNDYEETIRNVWVPRIEQVLPVKLQIEPGVSIDSMAKMRAEKSSPRHHIMYMDAPIVALAKQEDLIAPLDKKIMKNLANVYPEFILEGDYGVGIGAAAMGVTYYTQKPRPSSWADLWRPENKGKVSPAHFALTNGVAFWVMAGAIKSGKKPQEAQYDAEACFAGMGDLKQNIHSFWSSGGQGVQLTGAGEIWYMGSANTKDTFQAQDRGLPVAWVEPKEGAFQLLNSAVVVKNNSAISLSMQVLDMMLSEELQLALDLALKLGPTNMKVKLPESLASRVPYGPEAVKRLITIDWKYIQTKRDQWMERWNREVGG